jgi:hypothetical protein
MAADSLAKANASRHRAAVVAAHGALDQICREGRAVNFGAVSRAAGVSRTWLYGQADLRDRIASLRSAPLPAPSPEATTRASISSLRQRLESARAEISRLRAENSALLDQLARQLGAQRAQQAIPSVSGPR